MTMSTTAASRLTGEWGEGKKKSILESELKTKAKGPLRIWL
jgi:hypothetical protein